MLLPGFVELFKYLTSLVQLMTGERMPGFTAELSLGIYIQGYSFARTGIESSDIIPTQDTDTFKPGRGCCGGWCDSPCVARQCKDRPGHCCCDSS